MERYHIVVGTDRLQLTTTGDSGENVLGENIVIEIWNYLPLDAFFLGILCRAPVTSVISSTTILYFLHEVQDGRENRQPKLQA